MGSLIIYNRILSFIKRHIKKDAQWQEYCKREERIQNYIAKKNGTPHGTFLVPPDIDAHTDYSKRSFFVFKSEEDHGAQTSQFDRLLNGCKGYDPKLHRDDRANANSRGLHVNDEERKRTVPSVSSSEYGYRPPLETPSNDHRRICVVQTEFFSS